MKKSRKIFYSVILAGVLYAIVAQMVHSLGAFVSMGYYLKHEYFYVWSNIMMPAAGPPPASFYLISIIFGIISGILIAMAYRIVKRGIPGKTIAKKGLVYGLLLFLAAGIPGSLSMILLINLPLVLVMLWALESLIIYLIGGMIIAKTAA